MKRAIKERWLTALRSGTYKQGTGRLHRLDPDTDTDSFCCLGVLCDLAEKEGVAVEVHSNSDANLVLYDCATMVPPHSVCEWAEIDPNGRLIHVLVDLNDKHALNFSAIADYIEEHA